ncbi:MAPEG family protein [bacterium]|nr:MAPEG family protein [bacterium]
MDIIYPVFCLVMLTFIMAFATGISRLFSVRRKQINPKYYVLLSGDAPPDYVQKIGRNFSNLLEVPVLFYLLAVLVITLEINNALLLNLAWLYVALRLMHTIIHVSYNYVMHRFMVFALSVLTLLIMWVQFIMLVG